MIKRTPNSRQIVMSAWSAGQIDEMALPPCHVMYQFYVMGDELHCMLTQRSGDLGLGVPFNIASAALLTHMIAYICDLKTGDLVHSIGDAHVYNNHENALKEQLHRTPFMFPKLSFSRGRDVITSIDDFVSSDIVVRGYNNHGEVKMDMAV
jgi:thymidylate synthase